MKSARGVEVQFHAFLTLELDGGEWLASPPGRFTPGEIAPGAPKSVLTQREEKEIPSASLHYTYGYKLKVRSEH